MPTGIRLPQDVPARPAWIERCAPPAGAPAGEAGAALLAPGAEALRAPRAEGGSAVAVQEPAAPHVARGALARARGGFAQALKLALVTLFAYGLMFNFSVVRGSSMVPSIHDGDRILVDHLSYLFHDVRRGDIVVLQYPLDPAVDYIKRVIGLPGDEVVVEEGRVYVNDRLLEEPYVASRDPGSRLAVRVLEDHYFVLGDNRPHSSDSREFGQVRRDLLRGRVDLRVWPIGRAGTID